MLIHKTEINYGIIFHIQNKYPSKISKNLNVEDQYSGPCSWHLRWILRTHQVLVQQHETPVSTGTASWHQYSPPNPPSPTLWGLSWQWESENLRTSLPSKKALRSLSSNIASSQHPPGRSTPPVLTNQEKKVFLKAVGSLMHLEIKERKEISRLMYLPVSGRKNFLSTIWSS